MTSAKNSKRTTRKSKSKGLGDTIEKVTEATGIKKVVEWKEIPGYEGYYINEAGNVYSRRGRFKNTPKLLKQTLQNGYPSVSLYKTGNKGSGSGDTVYVHRLLAEAYIPKDSEEKNCVNHKDGVKTNNSLENLEWVTKAENNLHAFQNGLMTQMKYTKEDALKIFEEHHVNGKSRREISDEHGYPKHYIDDILTGKAGKSLGLGDDIEKLLNSKLVKPLTNSIKKVIWGADHEDCGCAERKEKLNKLFPYKQPECLAEWEHEYLGDFLKRNPNSVTSREQKTLLEIYNRVFHDSKPMSNCGPCVDRVIRDLESLYKEYEAAI